MKLLLSLLLTILQALSLIVLIHVVLSYFLPITNPIRKILGQIVEPLLLPIRKLVKPMGGLDLSPMVLLILIYFVELLLRAFLR
jgi:YggT family protein